MATSAFDLAGALRQTADFRPIPFGFVAALAKGDAAALPGEETIEQAFVRGVAEGQQLAAITHSVERQALLDLLASAEVFHHESCNHLSALIAAAVETLVRQALDSAPVDAAWLRARIDAAAAVISAADHDRIVCLNPDDAALLGDCPLGMPIRPDATLPRGEVRIETGAGWIESGRSTYLDALHLALTGAKDAA